MAGLLDRINAGGAKVLQALEAIATPNVYGDPSMEGMMTEEQRAAAKGYARSAGIAGMQEAAMNGVPWYALGSARDIKAMPAYRQYLDSAVSSVEELRKRRESEGRRDKVAELVGRLANPEDPLTQEYTPEQIALLATLPPDEQAALMAKKAFPKEAGLSVATAGTVQGGRFKLSNGNIGAMVQTGDPNQPVRIIDTGQPYVSEDPSLLRGLYGLQRDPSLIATARELEEQKKTGTDTGAANVNALVTLPGLINNAEHHRASTVKLRDELGALPSGALTGRVLQLFSSQFQAAEAATFTEALNNIAALAQAGVKLNPISVDELKILMSTSPKLTNSPDANVKILNDRISKLDKILKDLRDQLAVLDAGGNITDYRPGGVTPPRTDPVVPPTLRPGDVAEPPRGGPGSVSVIPTIRKPGQ